MPYIPEDRRDLLETSLEDYAVTLKGKTNLELCDAVLLVLSAFEDAASPGGDFDWNDEAANLCDDLGDLPNGPNVGDLNYTITCLLEKAVIGIEVRYSKLNRCAGILSTLRTGCAPVLQNADEDVCNRLIDCLGVLRCCEHEFLRRLHDPYEDSCIDRNGDCFNHYCR
jgi:hypothetical protein